MLTLRTLAPGLAAAIATAGLALAGALETTELSALDRLFELRGARPPAARIVVVSIDEDSFDELNVPWPFPRALHAELIDALSAARPLAIGFDVLFPEPSPRGPADDAALGAAVRRAGNVVLAAAITTVAEPLYVKTDLNAPLPVIRAGAAAVAPVSYAADVDGHIRRSALRQRLGRDALDSWDVAVYRLVAPRLPGAAALPGDDEIVINYRGRPRTFTWVPYHRVLDGGAPAETFRDAVVLVGSTSAVLHDVFPTPFAPLGTMPGVEIHANAIDTLLRGDRIRAAPRASGVGLAIAAALAAALLAARLRALHAFAAVAGLWIALALSAFELFAAWNVWFHAVGAMVGLALGCGLTVIDNYVREQRERRRLGRFFSPAVLREIVRHPSDVALGSRRRVVTVLFSDIRGFTSMSERLAPEQVAEMLGEYLTEMTEVVFRHGGTVDKYLGDGIMALYNAPFDDPDHAANAIRTALELHERTLALSARWQARFGAPIRNGVGITTGEAVVGTMGSRQRLEYTAIGDTVNLASRLEGLTKEYGSGILISEATHELVKSRFVTRELGALPVRGKSGPVKVYAVVPADVRRYPRVVLAAAGVVIAEASGLACTVVTRDVGEGGLALAGLPPEWAPGTRVRIRCEGGTLAKPVAADAAIVWRRGDVAGVAFTALDADVGPAIAEFVATRRRR